MAVPPIVHAEHRVVRALRNAGAGRRDHAQPLGNLRPIDRRAIDRLAAAGVVHEDGAGYWLDPAAYDVYRARRRRRVYAAMVVVLAAVAVLAAIGVIRF